MESNTGSFTCAIVCWGIGVVAGLATTLGLFFFAEWLFIQGAFIGLLVFAALGLLLQLTMCRSMEGPVEPGSAGKAAAPTAAKSAPAPAPKPAAKPKAAAEPKPAPAPAPAAADVGTRPAALDAARDGGPDDLKQIKGVGPKLEKLLHSLGFYHFDQVASWTADEVAWVDENLEGFKGRVSRDGWVEQAKILAAGGETEFSQRVEDGDVY